MYETTWPTLIRYPTICMKILRKTMTSYNILPPGRYSETLGTRSRNDIHSTASVSESIQVSSSLTILSQNWLCEPVRCHNLKKEE
jgi:hypothetical protein